ncbi:MAG: hypothetical protein ABI856_11450 [Nitrospira sp.]
MLRIDDIQQWPEPVAFGQIEAQGEPGNLGGTISVHIPIALNGTRSTNFKLLATGETFRELAGGWKNVSERRLGKLAMLAIQAGSGRAGAAPSVSWPQGIEGGPLTVIKKSGRPVSVTLPIILKGKTRILRFIAKSDAFGSLATFHFGDEVSDSRFGYLFRIALWTGHEKVIQPRPGQGGGRRKPIQRCAWKTASWLGPALLPPMHDALKENTESAIAIIKAMKKEVRGLKITPRGMAAFLIWKNWRNWRSKFPPGKLDWPSKITPIESDGLSQSGGFWDEIFHGQLKLKKFPWATLRKENPERFDALTQQGIEQLKAAGKNVDWSRFEREHPKQFGQTIEEFRQSYMRLNQFRRRVELPAAIASKLPKAAKKELTKKSSLGTFYIDVPYQGPQYILPKPFHEVVTDILENRDAFILLPD